ncbi:TetR/AcrR family transcriptional regulator [Streptomyces olivochromogenes]|uniref:TetR/AcrR family transcriptional regulator n=1 Tax=Streptomyces olivochromogenes TaxID=1963 RepID=UPI001F2942D7|nr:TetR/AcrR family transcriptional regulator [Streptomyces olivochromogenes]MCF3128786.1 TetR/AcrR family transcriptional regulator [Streptomyces olivochromogenes]
MARKREFDVDQAVDRAMDVFWRRGYAATSLQDLTSALGIGSGSLYAAFGSKEKLYGLALARYTSRNAAQLVAELESAKEVRPALRAVLMAMAEADLCDPDRGCMTVNAATERADDPDTAAHVSATLKLVESTIAGALERAQVRGELTADKNPAELARLLTTFIQGLRVMGKARAGREFVESAVDAAMRTLD